MSLFAGSLYLGAVLSLRETRTPGLSTTALEFQLTAAYPETLVSSDCVLVILSLHSHTHL